MTTKFGCQSRHRIWIDLYAEQDAMVFARISDHEQCLIVLNRGAACELQFELNLPGSDAPWQRVDADGDLQMIGLDCQVGAPDKSLQLWSRQISANDSVAART